MREHQRLFIGGEWVEPAGSGTIDVISPHSEELVGRVPEGSAADIDRRRGTRRLRQGRMAAPVARGAHRRRAEVQ